MATNPRIPSETRTANEGKRPQLVPNGPVDPKRPPSAVPGVMFAVLVAAALIAAIIYYMPRAPRKTLSPAAAQVPMQPAGSELEFSNLQISLAPGGGAMNLDGEVMNNGRRAILGAMVELEFRATGGRTAGTVAAPLIGMLRKGDILNTYNFDTDPIKPGQTRLFRISANSIPTGWDHNMPEMKVLTVAAEGNR